MQSKSLFLEDCTALKMNWKYRGSDHITVKELNDSITQKVNA